MAASEDPNASAKTEDGQTEGEFNNNAMFNNMGGMNGQMGFGFPGQGNFNGMGMNGMTGMNMPNMMGNAGWNNMNPMGTCSRISQNVHH